MFQSKGVLFITEKTPVDWEAVVDLPITCRNSGLRTAGILRRNWPAKS
jgi:hypothetical protein